MAKAASDIESFTQLLRETAEKQQAAKEKIKENRDALALVNDEIEKLTKESEHLQSQVVELEAQLSHKEERWMYLTELKEKIDAQGK